jgi:prepilin-type N-terminal cleavage/methylation domain-containing protein
MKRGYTIIEIIIALAIAAVIFSGTLPLIYKTITANRKAQLRLNAYQAAHQELESLRGVPIGDLSDHSFSVSGVPGANGTLTVDKSLNGQPQTSIAKVTSKVTWTFQTKTDSVELNTYLYGEQ